MSRAELRRHARDSVSLVLGVLVLAVAGAFLVGDTTDLRLDGRWVAPVLLLGLGAAGLLASLRSRPDEADRPEPADR